MDQRAVTARHFVQAVDALIKGRQDVARQKQVVAGLIRDGHDAEQAELLLKTFLETQALQERHLEMLQRELEADL